MRYLKIFLSGCITTSASFNPYLWPISLYGLILLHQEIQTQNKLYLLGLIWGMGFYSLSYYWIIYPIHNMAQLPYLLSSILAILAIIYFAQLPALTLFLIKKTDKNLLTIVIIWGALEFIVSNFAITFPWSLIGYLMVKSPWANLASVGGVYLVSMLTILISGILSRPIYKQHIVVALLTLAIPFIFKNNISSIGSLNVAWTETFRDNFAKWQQPLMLDNTLKQASPANIDLKVWPEGALSWVLEQNHPKIESTPTITGIFHQHNGKIYNSAALFDHNTTTIVSKKYLVPFGEYIPFNYILKPLLKNLNIPMSNLSSDDNLSIIKFKGFSLATLICYEIAFPLWSWTNLKHSNALIVITDDHWFNSKLAIQQHLNIFKMRLLESQQSGLFVNDNGYSQIINTAPAEGLNMTKFQTPIIKYNKYLIFFIFSILLTLRSIIAKL